MKEELIAFLNQEKEYNRLDDVPNLVERIIDIVHRAEQRRHQVTAPLKVELRKIEQTYLV